MTIIADGSKIGKFRIYCETFANQCDCLTSLDLGTRFRNCRSELMLKETHQANRLFLYRKSHSHFATSLLFTIAWHPPSRSLALFNQAQEVFKYFLYDHQNIFIYGVQELYSKLLKETLYSGCY